MGNLGYYLVVLVTLVGGFACTRAIRRAFSRFHSREQKAGKELIYRHFPRKKKPLGGGMAIFAALTAGVGVAWGLHAVHALPDSDLPLVTIWLLCGLAFGGIGFIDDWRKVNAARGLGEWMKLTLQLILALIFALLILNAKLDLIQGSHAPHDVTSVFFPFVGWVSLGFLFLPFCMFIIVGSTNAVNLTDGLDGLA
ncbi:MAG TPA: hypothetical protein VGL77_18840, partial [Armatimonadota bacterium]